MDLEGGLDLLGCHALAKAVFAVDADALAAAARAAGDLVGIAHLDALRQLRVLLHLLLCVPEPLVDLILLKVEFLGEVADLVARGSLALQTLVEVPQGVLLALALSRAVRLLVLQHGSAHALALRQIASLTRQFAFLRGGCAHARRLLLKRFSLALPGRRGLRLGRRSRLFLCSLLPS